jgi:hypothetical protein
LPPVSFPDEEALARLRSFDDVIDPYTVRELVKSNDGACKSPQFKMVVFVDGISNIVRAMGNELD